MSRFRSFLIRVVVVLLLLVCAGGAGIWWYFFGPNGVSAAELVPADTVAFATIPNAMTIATGYETSQLKTLVNDPNAKPVIDSITTALGQKNIDLIEAFAPNLSGQSFIAVTHFDVDHPAQVGLIAAMKPKAGLGDFNAFVDKLKATYPDVVKQGTTGTGTVAGLDYQWIQGPGAPDKICVAQYHGWIVTAWGEAALQDWVERYQKKSATPSLAQNPDYIKSLTRVGKDPMALAYLNYHAILEILEKQMVKANPASGDYLRKRLGAVGGAAISTRFENGEIVDRFSFLMPRQAQLDAGMGGATPCPFDTLKFTGSDTRFYLGTSINLQQYWKNLQEQAALTPPPNPLIANLVTALQTWAQGAGLDVQHNIIDPLGSELSVQMEWTADTAYPEIGLFVKLDKPDDFKPTITAIIESVRKAYTASAAVKELHVDNGTSFAALNFFQAAPISPTITEGGPYLGIFMTENQAVRAFSRDPTLGLPHNADFARQVGDKRNGAAQILFLDSPQLLNRAYQTAMPYLSIASMFNKQLGALLKGKTLPNDLTWLAPMGTWSCVVAPDDDGIEGYSVSGVGNQGMVLAMSLGGAAGFAQAMGLFPKAQPNFGLAPAVPQQVVNPGATNLNPMPAPPADLTETNAPPVPAGDTNAPAPTSAPMPEATTNAPPASTPEPATNSSTEAAPAVPDTATNAPPATVPEPAPATNSVPVTNSASDATPPTPEPAKTQ